MSRASRARVRPPAVAGQFYPAESDRLARTVDDLLGQARIAASTALQNAPENAPHNAPENAPLSAAEPAVAYVVPHAGYRYSGPVAAHAYAHLDASLRQRGADPPLRIILIGPTHFVRVPGCAVSSAAAWRTPLGLVPLDEAGAAGLVAQGLAIVSDLAHAREHSLEVQLPFLLRIQRHESCTVLPIVVGDATVEQVIAVLDRTAGRRGSTAVVLCSTDLSHYLDVKSARQRDNATVEAILALDPDRIGPGDACGRHALRGLLGWAMRADLVPALLHQATSADVPGGDPSRVVGYAAFSFAPHRHDGASHSGD